MYEQVHAELFGFQAKILTVTQPAVDNFHAHRHVLHMSPDIYRFNWYSSGWTVTARTGAFTWLELKMSSDICQKSKMGSVVCSQIQMQLQN